MKLGKLSELKKTIGQIINEANSKEFPRELSYSRGIEYPKFKITIEEIEEDFFIDSKGVKWIKSKEEKDVIHDKSFALKK